MTGSADRMSLASQRCTLRGFLILIYERSEYTSVVRRRATIGHGRMTGSADKRREFLIRTLVLPVSSDRRSIFPRADFICTPDLERFPLYKTGVQNQQIQCQIGGTEPPPPGSQIKGTVHGNPGKPGVQHHPLLGSNRGYRTTYVVIKLGVDDILVCTPGFQMGYTLDLLFGRGTGQSGYRPRKSLFVKGTGQNVLYP